MKFLNIFKRNFIKGDLFFTFPDGKKLFKVKDADLSKLPAKHFLAIQENSNYLAFLGVTKENLQNAVNRIDKNTFLLDISTDFNEVKRLSGEIRSVTHFLKINTSEFDRASDAIALNLFDLFFYFQGENPIQKTMETMELKKYYLDTYPFFKVFFFQEVRKHFTDFMPTLKPYIDFALLQMEIFQKLQIQSNTPQN